MARQYGSDEQARRRKTDRFIFTAVCLAVSLIVVVLSSGNEDYSPLLLAYNRACGQISGAEAQVPEGRMIIHMIDVGQGDCVLVQCSSANVLIDAGEYGMGDDVVDYLSSIGVKELDWVICSHPHSDHIGGIPEVLGSVKIGEVIVPDIPDELIPYDYSYRNLVGSLRSGDVSVTKAQPGTVYDCGEMTMTVLYPASDMVCSELNDWSVCVRVSFGDLDFLCCGDLTEDGEKLLMESGVELEAEILKSSHHGSALSGSDDFLSAVSAELALISCGAGNDYGHPHDALLRRYEEHGIIWKRTDVCGDIRVICEDGKYTIES